MMFNKLALLLPPFLMVAVHCAGFSGAQGGSQLGTNFMAPIPSHFLRGLQPDPPDLPDPPDDVGEGEPASYCDFLFLLFDAQASAYGFDCDCVSDDEKDTVTCNSRSLTCDALNVGDVDMICHSTHF